MSRGSAFVTVASTLAAATTGLSLAMGWTQLVLALLLVASLPFLYEGLVRARLTIEQGLLLTLVVVAFAPLPVSVPGGVSFAGNTLDWASLVCLVAVGLWLLRAQAGSRGLLWSVAAVFSVAAFSAVGFVNGADVAYWWRDVRGLLHLAVAAVLVYRTRGPRQLRLLLHTSGVIVSVTAVGVVLAALGVQVFAFRAESAALYVGQASEVYSSTRVIAPAGVMAGALGGVLIACLLMGWARTLGRPPCRVRLWTGVGYLVASLVVVALSFTRGYFVVLVVISLASLAPAASRGWVAVRAVAVCTGVGVVGVAVTSLRGWFPGPLVAFVDGAVEAFSGRVLAGLQPGTISADTSTTWRFRETSEALDAFSENWLVGVGFGAPYRQILPGEVFEGREGLTYIHSSYIWILTKVGLLGSLLVLWLLVLWMRALTRQSGRPPAATGLLGFAMLALAAQMLTSPTPFEIENSVLVGVLVGLTMATSRPARSTVGAGIDTHTPVTSAVRG
ncbi:O-antigen ligase family protein [Geodermatophilus amargosae]|uniref:O-antigen ligase family protein n=1 Tax=Geodermatophilus amargosae TaxID=1296565 RepID=UPI0034DFF71B